MRVCAFQVTSLECTFKNNNNHNHNGERLKFQQGPVWMYWVCSTCAIGSCHADTSRHTMHSQAKDVNKHNCPAILFGRNKSLRQNSAASHWAQERAQKGDAPVSKISTWAMNHTAGQLGTCGPHSLCHHCHDLTDWGPDWGSIKPPLEERTVYWLFRLSHGAACFQIPPLFVCFIMIVGELPLASFWTEYWSPSDKKATHPWCTSKVTRTCSVVLGPRQGQPAMWEIAHEHTNDSLYQESQASVTKGHRKYLMKLVTFTSTKRIWQGQSLLPPLYTHTHLEYDILLRLEELTFQPPWPASMSRIDHV